MAVPREVGGIIGMGSDAMNYFVATHLVSKHLFERDEFSFSIQEIPEAASHTFSTRDGRCGG
jgi:hypothetical protein